MELFIRIANGVTVGNPIMGDNFREALPDIDVDNLPPEFARFVRVERPVLGTYQVFVQENPAHELVGGVWTDVWHVRDMTAEEKAAKQQPIKDKWDAIPNKENYLAWTFNEDLLIYEPPVPQPIDGKRYIWQGTTNTWVEVPPKPQDGKTYKLDFASATWVEII
jgi:hypothetical protein